MQQASFLQNQKNIQKAFEHLAERLGGVESEPFLHAGVIANVADPENKSRVKVVYGKDEASTKTDWIPVLNSGAGKLSSQFINANCVVACIAGDVNNGIVVGVYNSEISASLPPKIPSIDKMAVQYSKDPGLSCNKDNEGRMYIFSNNVSQDLKICLRRNNRQEGPDKDVWEWKNITRGLVIEGSEDPKEIGKGNVVINEKPLQKCRKELEGEQIQFSEDRSYRQTNLTCKKDENGKWAWTPVSAVPTYFRATLPKCSEKIHGQTALIDDGNNSELGICVRYNKEMKWVKYGSREVIKFSDIEPLISKSELIKTIPNPELKIGEKEKATMGSSALGSSPLSPALTNDILKAGLGAVTGAFSGSSDFSSLAQQSLAGVNPIASAAMQMGFAAIEGNELNVDSVITALQTAQSPESISSEILNTLGPIAVEEINKQLSQNA